jgi:SIR2-like domain
MITKPTTLLLGAGASAHLGYPVGYQLRDQILAELKMQLSLPEDKRIPILRDGDALIGFHTKMSRGGWTSPDAFLEKHTEFLQMGKFLIAYCLKRKEDPDSLFPATGWYEYLCQRLLAGSETSEDFRGNDKLSIVTYNYDRSMDHFLHQLVRHRYELSSDVAWELLRSTIKIVHVHGILGSYPEYPYEVSQDIEVISSLSNSIKIIHEVEPSHEAFSRASQLLNSAEAVYSVGFSMSDTNMKRISHFTDMTPDGRRIHGPDTFKCAMGGLSPLEIEQTANRLSVYNINKSDLLSHTSDVFFKYAVSLE